MENSWIIRFAANNCVRADHHALAALDADAASQTGTSVARLRFSQRDVPVGNVPSQGIALTGTRRRARDDSPSTSRTNPVRASSHRRASRLDSTQPLRHFDFVQMRERLIDRVEDSSARPLRLFCRKSCGSNP